MPTHRLRLPFGPSNLSSLSLPSTDTGEGARDMFTSSSAASEYRNNCPPEDSRNGDARLPLSSKWRHAAIHTAAASMAGELAPRFREMLSQQIFPRVRANPSYLESQLSLHFLVHVERCEACRH